MTFLDNLELNFDYLAEKSPYLIVVIGDFNTNLNSWYSNDITNIKGSKIDILTFTSGF